eukprot:3085480-Heterocapsa_arctica.AAC.1
MDGISVGILHVQYIRDLAFDITQQSISWPPSSSNDRAVTGQVSSYRGEERRGREGGRKGRIKGTGTTHNMVPVCTEALQMLVLCHGCKGNTSNRAMISHSKRGTIVCSIPRSSWVTAVGVTSQTSR